MSCAWSGVLCVRLLVVTGPQEPGLQQCQGASHAPVSRRWCQGAPTPAPLPRSPNAEAPPLRITSQGQAQNLPSSPSPLVAFASRLPGCLEMMISVDPSQRHPPIPWMPPVAEVQRPPNPVLGCLQNDGFRENKPLPSLKRFPASHL